MEIESKFGLVKIYAKTIEESAISQIIQMANSPIGENSHTRIMPDAHAGKGCVIGTTMIVTDKVCPNVVGADIGCGVTLVKTNINFKEHLDELTNIIETLIPYGPAVHKYTKKYDFTSLRCWNKLSKDAKEVANYCLGSLGGGNHFIEAYDDGYLSVHSGSRMIGKSVAEYYQKLAEKSVLNKQMELRNKMMTEVPKEEHDKWLKKNQIHVNQQLCYLEGNDLKDYLHDIDIIQKFADANRHTMLSVITKNLKGKILEEINSIHNYIDVKNSILRKGAISAQKGEVLVIPLNMKDGMLICTGKGNPDWNYSAPHGAGRLYSRSEAKELISLEDYQKIMEGICAPGLGYSTIDESPFAYKDYKEIMECIEPTVEINKRLIPIFNFKAH
ncbi:MAG: RtcB family protein [Clostridia bacterium]|nr:RtcB family protein [Clostridia bacterium]